METQGTRQGSTTGVHHDSRQVTPTAQLTRTAPKADKKAEQQETPSTPGRGGNRERDTEEESPNKRDKKMARTEDDGTGDTVMAEAARKEDSNEVNHHDQDPTTAAGKQGRPTEDQKEHKEDPQQEHPTMEAELPIGSSQEFRLRFTDPSKTDKVTPVTPEDRDYCTDRMAHLMFKFLKVEDPEDQEAIKHKEGPWDTFVTGIGSNAMKKCETLTKKEKSYVLSSAVAWAKTPPEALIDVTVDNNKSKMSFPMIPCNMVWAACQKKFGAVWRTKTSPTHAQGSDKKKGTSTMPQNAVVAPATSKKKGRPKA